MYMQAHPNKCRSQAGNATRYNSFQKRRLRSSSGSLSILINVVIYQPSTALVGSQLSNLNFGSIILRWYEGSALGTRCLTRARPLHLHTHDRHISPKLKSLVSHTPRMTLMKRCGCLPYRPRLTKYVVKLCLVPAAWSWLFQIVAYCVKH
jgi:hypothetical protein